MGFKFQKGPHILYFRINKLMKKWYLCLCQPFPTWGHPLHPSTLSRLRLAPVRGLLLTRLRCPYQQLWLPKMSSLPVTMGGMEAVARYSSRQRSLTALSQVGLVSNDLALALSIPLELRPECPLNGPSWGLGSLCLRKAKLGTGCWS